MFEFIYEYSELTQALIMFGGMVLMIALGVPIPIAVAMGTIIGYVFLDFPFVAIAQGRNRLVLGEIPWVGAGLGVLAAGLLWVFHDRLFG